MRKEPCSDFTQHAVHVISLCSVHTVGEPDLVCKLFKFVFFFLSSLLKGVETQQTGPTIVGLTFDIGFHKLRLGNF